MDYTSLKPELALDEEFHHTENVKLDKKFKAFQNALNQLMARNGSLLARTRSLQYAYEAGVSEQHRLEGRINQIWKHLTPKQIADIMFEDNQTSEEKHNA